MFKLKKPCKNCPFRKDAKKGWLGKESITEIANNLKADGYFLCHKHVDYKNQSDDISEQKYSPTGRDQFCAGALILMKKEDILYNNLSVRIGAMGLAKDDSFNENQLKSLNLIVDSFNDLIEKHTR